MEIHQGVSGGERCASVISSQRQEQNTESLKYWRQTKTQIKGFLDSV